MEKIGIRDVRASRLRGLANEGTQAAITDNRELVGIFCPVTQDWLTQVLAMNSSRLEQSLHRGEQELVIRGANVPTLEAIEASAHTEESDAGRLNPFGAVSGVVSAVSAVMGRAGLAVLDKTTTDKTAHKTIGIAQLDGDAIRQAAHNQQTLAITDRRELIGVIVPVGDILSHVMRTNLSRIEANILKGNQELRAGRGRLLDELADDAGTVDGIAAAHA